LQESPSQPGFISTTIFSASALKRRFKPGKDLFRAWIESQKGEAPGTLEFGAALGRVTFDLGLYSVLGGQKRN
jgi:hypothetical protein